MRAVGVIEYAGSIVCRDDVRVLSLVVLSKTESCGLSRCSLEVIEVAVLLLVFGKLLSHVVENISCELLCLFVSEVLSEPSCVETCLVHTNKTDC